MAKKNLASSAAMHHNHAVQYDRMQRPTLPPPDPLIAARLSELVHPATYAQLNAFHDLGLRERSLTLPVFTALVLSMIWRHMGSVSEAVRVLEEEGLLWSAPRHVSQQAVSERFSSLPASLFDGILMEVMPQLLTRAQERDRPMPKHLATALEHFSAVVAFDGSTLDTLIRKTGLLREGSTHPLGGRMAALLDVSYLLPRNVWYESNSQAHDTAFFERISAALAPGMLALMDRGFFKHAHFDALTERGVSFITRLNAKSTYRVCYVITDGKHVRDQVIELGCKKRACRHRLRLVEVRRGAKTYQYVTNVLDPSVLSSEAVVACYAERWRIEDAFKLVKRLLGLAYFFNGSQNGVLVQLWASWLLYSVLMDLSDAVAETLHKPLRKISVPMVFRGLYHFTQAYHRGRATDPVHYLATHARNLGIVKRKRRKPLMLPDTPLIISPTP